MKLDYIHLGDCLEWMKTIPERSVDVIWTDPSYGNNNKDGRDIHSNIKLACNYGSREVHIEEIRNDSPEDHEIIVIGALNEFSRILKKDSACCVCCSGGGGT